MAVAIVLAGTYSQGSFLRRRSPSRMLDEIGTWWRQHALEHEPRVDVDHHGVEPSLGLVLHPAVEPVVFEIPAPGTLTITANTSTGGPGYHRTLVGGLKRMARDLSIDWANGQLVQGLGDETRYFETGDTGAVDKAMLDWAHGLAEAIIDHADADATDFTIGMPPDWGFTSDAFATTSLGPRDRQFFERIAEDRAAGVALFPWWPDRPDAAFYRDRALVRMWSDVRWRPPLDDVESRVLAAVDRDLERAVAGGAPGIPWDAWTEVRALVGRPPVAGPDGERDTGGVSVPIGYRRGQVRVRFADWELEVPGSLADATTDDGDRVLFDDTANVRVSTFERSDRSEDESVTDAILAYGLTDGQLAAVVDEGGIVGWASERKLEGDDAGFVALQGLAAAPAALAFVTISHAPARADWAAATFRSIRWKPLRGGAPGHDDDRPPTEPTWTAEERDRVLVQAGLGALLREPDTPRYVIVERSSWVSSGYVQAVGEPGSGIRAELAGAANDPAMADPDRIARVTELGWGPADPAFAGNHTVVYPAPVDLVALATLIVRTMRDVHSTPVGGLRITVDETGSPPT